MLRPALAAILALAVAACSAPSDVASTPASAIAATSTADAVRQITLEFGRGFVYHGRHYGSGGIGVVLAHMGGADDTQEDWAPLAEELVHAGYQVVTWDHDAQAVSRQVLAAVEYLRGQGAETVVVGGASLGAMASLRAAQEPEGGVAGVVWLAGVRLGGGYAFEEEDIAALACPILFASGVDDEEGAADDAEQLSVWARKADLLLVPSTLHGTDILAEGGPAAEQLRSGILEFLERVSATPDAECA